MNFSKLSLVCLALDFGSRFVQAQGVANKNRVGKWELHSLSDAEIEVSDSDTPSTAAVETEMFYEGFFADGQDPIVEIYAGVEVGAPCVTGTPATPLGETTPSLSVEFYTADTNDHPDLVENMVTSNGDIGYVQIHQTLIGEDNPFWTPYKDDRPDVGTFSMCVRVCKKLETRYISYVDSLITVRYDHEGVFQSFAASIDVEEISSTNEYVQDEFNSVPVEAFPCFTTGSPIQETYKPGQRFSICVRPGEDDRQNGFGVSGFQEVTCAEESQIVKEGSYVVAITSVSSDTDAVDFLDKDEVAVGPGTAVLTTTVLPTMVSGSGSMTCTGVVELTFTAPGSRDLSPVGRRLQATGTGVGESTQFSVSIKVSEEKDWSDVFVSPAAGIFEGSDGLVVAGAATTAAVVMAAAL